MSPAIEQGLHPVPHARALGNPRGEPGSKAWVPQQVKQGPLAPRRQASPLKGGPQARIWTQAIQRPPNGTGQVSGCQISSSCATSKATQLHGQGQRPEGLGPAQREQRSPDRAMCRFQRDSAPPCSTHLHSTSCSGPEIRRQPGRHSPWPLITLTAQGAFLDARSMEVG